MANHPCASDILRAQTVGFHAEVFQEEEPDSGKLENTPLASVHTKKSAVENLSLRITSACLASSMSKCLPSLALRLGAPPLSRQAPSDSFDPTRKGAQFLKQAFDDITQIDRRFPRADGGIHVEDDLPRRPSAAQHDVGAYGHQWDRMAPEPPKARSNGMRMQNASQLQHQDNCDRLHASHGVVRAVWASVDATSRA